MTTSDRRRLTPQLVLGLAVLVLGVVLTLDNFDVIDAHRVLRYWPVILIVFGLARIWACPTTSCIVSGLLFAAAGTWLLLHNLNVVEASLLQLWPVVLVLVGLSIVRRAFFGPRGAPGESSASADSSAFALWSGAEHGNSSTAFRRADATAIMGGVELDLRRAQMAGERAVVDVFALWGGVEILVPEDWTVECRAYPIMGAVEDKTRHPLPDPATSAKILEVRGMVIMGGTEVKNNPDKECGD